MKKYTWLIILCLPFFGISQNNLSIELLGVKSSMGNINVAVYNQAKGFLKFDGVFKVDRIAAKEAITTLKIMDLPNGEYAVAIFHDENGNDKLDTNWLGIPKESVAFSNAKIKAFGPPSYKECAFNLNTDLDLKMQFD
jgi:uncharacterized protein (DUF2141 family)